jgi:hypothetical protein
MAKEVNSNSMLIKDGTPLPEGIPLKGESYLAGWRLTTNRDSAGLDRKIRDAGWTFFFMAGEIKVHAFGVDAEFTRRKAIRQILAKLKLSKFNCLEIAQVTARRFLGFPYVTITAHWRHIQESLFLFHATPRAEWDGAELAAV